MSYIDCHNAKCQTGKMVLIIKSTVISRITEYIGKIIFCQSCQFGGQ
uniref:Uncharacterized protein n=1 Tax=Leuconostoc citreum TaxID=33964 RepID=A0A098DLN3_LEUCI|nr:Protein of unknown function [Leuconostoc citreum]